MTKLWKYPSGSPLPSAPHTYIFLSRCQENTMGRNTSNFRFGSLGFLPARSLFWNGSPTYFQPLSFLWGMYLEVLDTYLRSAPFPISVVRLSGIGRYLLFIRRVSDRCQKNIRYLLMIQHQILFLNLLNKRHDEIWQWIIRCVLTSNLMNKR